MRIAFAKPQLPTAGAVVVGVLANRRLGPSAATLDRRARGALSRAMAASRFKGNSDQLLAVLAPAGGRLTRIVLAGLGKPARLDALAAEAIGGRMAAFLGASGETAAVVMVDRIAECRMAPGDFAAHLAYGARLRSYRFDKYRTAEKPERKPSLKRLTVAVADHAATRRAFERLDKIADAVFFARDLVSEPANVIHPETLALQAKSLSGLGVDVEILGEKQLEKLGMNALLGVGRGSARESQLVVMQWRGDPGAKDQRPLAFVGKGVTFDSGGISIKPASGMEEMKWDMAGSAAVIGVMRALAARGAKVNAVGVIGLVENMPSGTAQRPGDIVKSMSGQTIEVINTDAEGRLVLADALWYCRDRFKPRAMVDLATLTGAIVVALGKEHAGLFANDDELAGRLLAAGKAEGEKLWRMPMGKAYDKAIDSDVADMKNTGNRWGGSISGAQFLKRFVKDTAWAHLDIAGTAWADKDRPTVPKGASAFGVRLLDRLVADHYEG